MGDHTMPPPNRRVTPPDRTAPTLDNAVRMMRALTYKDFIELAGLIQGDADKMIEGLENHKEGKQ